MNRYETPFLVDVEELSGCCGCGTGGGSRWGCEPTAEA